VVILEAGGLGCRREGRALLDGVGLQAQAGEVVVVLGPNGAGKSTLMRHLCGEWTATSGEVCLQGRPLFAWSATDRALRMAVLSQQSLLDFPYPVRDIVGWGRMPHATGQERDDQVVRECLAFCDVTHLAEEPWTHLSGGERQRVQWARVLAQVWETPNAALLLDEPTSALDLAHQHQLLAGLRERVRQRQQTVVMTLHDLNLAARYADRILLLQCGRVVAAGDTSSILSPDLIRQVFGIDVRVVAHPHDDHPVVVI
jgi:iron complex transport system ATP-binding protein